MSVRGLDLARDLATAEYATWIAADHGEVAAADSGAGVLATSAGALAAVWLGYLVPELLVPIIIAFAHHPV